jgi:hypothetical protein
MALLAWLIVLVGTILVFVSAFPAVGASAHVWLFRLGCGMVFAGAFVIPGLPH